MSAVFDQIARNYDNEFTHSLIGKHQRERVYGYLDENVFKASDGLSILELNCGTGIDAIYFSALGHEVLATDISESMITKSIQNSKAANAQNVSFKKMDIRKMNESDLSEFDLVFSNFGGLNCLSKKDLEVLDGKLTRILKPNGRFIAVVMPRFTFLELSFCLIKFKLSRIIKRIIGKMKVKVGEDSILTYYYNYLKMNGYLKSGEEINLKPVGFVPSYLNAFFEKNMAWYLRINKFEDNAYQNGRLINFSDHYLIDLKYNAK